MSIANLKLMYPKGKLYAFFVDFKAAFDTINRNALLYKLSKLGLSTKMVNIIKAIYRCTKAAVWNGNEVSDLFDVNKGVRQGCLLSPLLFSLYMNDLHDELPGGVSVGDIHVKILLYADDIVLLSEDRTSLQAMIDKLAEYCKVWSLTVNLTKSKVMIFRRGPRIAAADNFNYDNTTIDVVNEYQYLGVKLTYNVSFNKHLKAKLSSAKAAINMVWKDFISNKSIGVSNKKLVYESTCRSVMCYAAQVWGCKHFDDVEKLQRFFIKKMLKLPSHTPNYMLFLETNIVQAYNYSLKLHLDYIRKVFKMPLNRLPRLLAEETIIQNVYWARDWREIYDTAEVDLNLLAANVNWQQSHKNLLEALQRTQKQEYIRQAESAMNHDEYVNVLRRTAVPNYFNDKLSCDDISRIFKTRGGLLNLNAKVFHTNTDSNCTICNLNEPEDTYHFIARCPIFNSIRRSCFGKDRLMIDEFYTILDGQCYVLLSQYVSSAYRYRSLILNEFN